jgi:phosphohistidine phosphatase
MIFGHNPGLTDFADMMCRDFNADNIPTCGVVALSFDTAVWDDISAKNCELLFFDYPKSIKD